MLMGFNTRIEQITTDVEQSMNVLTKTLLATSLIGATTFAIATTVVNNTQALNSAPLVDTTVKAQPASAVVNQAAIQPVIQTVDPSVAINQNAIAPKVSSVKQASSMADDSYVQLKGYVVKSLGDEKYQFRDSTGSMTVDIDDELWQGQAISATTLITIQGEVDIDYKPMKRVEIDVDAVYF